jgi:hypothetical protein
VEGSGILFDKFNTEEICITFAATAIEAWSKTQRCQV